MKLYFLLSAVIFLGGSHHLHTTKVAEQYDILEVYKGIPPATGTMVLTDDDDLVDPEVILAPITLEVGKYAAEVTRKADDLYQIDGKNIYIKTNYCSEYSYGDEVIVKIESSYGYTKGVIIFLN